MFDTSKAFSGFSVDDLEAARTFYGETLGLAVADDDMGFLTITLDSGATILAYPKDDHSPASYTMLNFPVDDVGAAVSDLVARGVSMQRYEGMDQDAAGVMRGHGPDIAWFTDPAGNVISVLSAD